MDIEESLDQLRGRVLRVRRLGKLTGWRKVSEEIGITETTLRTFLFDTGDVSLRTVGMIERWAVAVEAAQASTQGKDGVQ